MQLTKIFLKNFTVFRKIDVDLNPGLNVFPDEPGNEHLLKVAYAACIAVQTKTDFDETLVNIFRPDDGKISRLIRRSGYDEEAIKASSPLKAAIRIQSDNLAQMRCTISHSSVPNIFSPADWYKQKIEAVFIPAEDMLAHAPGFLSLYNMREISYSQVYHDILIKAFRFPLRVGVSAEQQKVLELLESSDGMNGEVGIYCGEHFSLQRPNGDKVEWSLLSHAEQKLGFLWLLVQRGCLEPGSILFWDYPEAGLNPQKLKLLNQVLDILQRTGVQMLLSCSQKGIIAC